MLHLFYAHNEDMARRQAVEVCDNYIMMQFDVNFGQFDLVLLMRVIGHSAALIASVKHNCVQRALSQDLEKSGTTVTVIIQK